jgi:hypothetical protein
VAKEGVYAGDLSIGDIVRVQAQIWRVARVDRCGPDEVEVAFVKPDDSDQLIANLRPGEVIERVT